MRTRLTDAAIKNVLKQRLEDPAFTGVRASVRDTDLAGFVMRVSQTGRVSLCYEYRPRGIGRSASPTLLTIGTWPALKADQARKVAMGHLVDVSRGGDPKAEQRVRKTQAAAETLGDLLAEDGAYERSLKRRHLVNWKVALSSLRRELKPFMAYEPQGLARKDLARRIAGLEDAGKPGAADDLRKFSYSFLEWCVEHDYVAHNPLAGWKRPPKTRAQRLAGKEPAGRALEDHEIARLWQAADAIDFAPFGALVQLGLLTAMRRGELAGLQWTTNILAGRILLQPHLTKQGRAHEVPLTALMRSVLAGVPKTTSKLVFASPVTGGQIAGWTRLVARLQRTSGVDFRMHDLRRTCRTLMGKLGIPEADAELSIGHQRAALVRLYDFDERWSVRVDAFQRVSDHIAKLVHADTADVVALHQPAKPRGHG